MNKTRKPPQRGRGLVEQSPGSLKRKIVDKDRQMNVFQSSNFFDGSQATCEYRCLAYVEHTLVEDDCADGRVGVFERSKPSGQREFIVAPIPRDWPTGKSLFDAKLCAHCSRPGSAIASFDDEEKAIQALARWARRHPTKERGG
jgi:hypothetical protein